MTRGRQSALPAGSAFGIRRQCLHAVACLVIAGVLQALPGLARAQEAPRERVFAVNGATLHTVSSGSGQPVVVIHGGPGLDHGYMLSFMEGLSATNRVILYDQRGVGGSVAPLDGASITMDNYLADLDGLRAALGLEKLNLIAHSFGALIGMLYAIDYPDRVSSLVLMSPVEPGHRFVEEQAALQRGRRTRADSVELAGLMASPGFRARDRLVYERIFRLSYRSTFSDPALASRLQIHLAEATAKHGSEVARLLIGPLGDYDYWDRLRGIRAPVLIIQGEDDLIPMAVAAALSRSIPGARLLRVQRAGHFPYIEAPTIVYDAIRRFIAGAEGAAGSQ